jgi:hypothetical protein
LLRNRGSEHFSKSSHRSPPPPPPPPQPQPPPPPLVLFRLCFWRQSFKGDRQGTPNTDTFRFIPYHQFPISAFYCMAGSAAAFDYTALECGPRLKRFKSDLDDAIKGAITTQSS